MTIGLDMGGSFLWWAACYATSKNIEGCSRKLVIATAAAPVTVASVGRADRVIRVLRPISGIVRSRTTCVTSSSNGWPACAMMSPRTMCRIESVDDGDRAVPNVSGNIEHQKRRGLVSRVRLGEQCCASLRMRHRLASGNDARVGVELFVDGVGGAVAFQASDIAAVAWLAVHVDGDVSDFRGGAVLAVVDGAVVDDPRPMPSPSR